MSGYSGKSDKGAPLSVDVPPRRLARLITVFALGCFAAIAVINVLAEGGSQPTYLLGYLAIVAVIFGVQLAHTVPGARRWPLRQRAASLTLQGVLTYLPLVVFGMSWGGMGGPLAGSVLLLLPGRVAWVLFAAIAASFALVPAAYGVPLLPTVYFTISTVLTGLVIFGLTRLNDLVAEVHSTRGQVAALAVERERLRFARDLHDLLGYSLSAITLKSEVVHRLLPGDPHRAREEVASTLEVARQALADIRAVSQGYRELSIAAEAERVKSVLSAAGIDSRVTVGSFSPGPAIDTVLAAVLREGVTNVLRHSSVRQCAITMRVHDDRAVLEIVNDGLDSRLPSPSANGGSGLPNLRERASDVGGRLEAGPCGGGRYRLRVTVPLDVDRGGEDPRALVVASP